MNVLAITGTHVIPRRSPPPRTSQTLRQWFAMASGRVALIGVLLFVAYAVWLFVDPWPSYRLLIADLWHLPFFAAASVACWSTSRIAGIEPRLRRAYRLGALALFCATLGNGWSFVMKDLLGRSASIGSVTDVVYLASYPLLFTALLSFPQVARTRSELVKLALDVGTVVLVGLAAVWHFVIEPALANPTLMPVATILAVVYPVADIVLLFGSAFAFLHRPAPGSSGALALVATA